MKKLMLIFSMVFLLGNCTTILERYTEPKVRTTPVRYVEYYDYTPYYYSCYIPYPICGGFYFYWYPYSYYGYYNYPSYRNYPYQWRYRYGVRRSTSVISKKQLTARGGATSKIVVKARVVKKPTQTTATRSTGQRTATVKKKK